MELESFCDRFDSRLRTAAFTEIDSSANGLQVGRNGSEVSHAAFAVDAAVESIDAARSRGADVLVVHHGLSWDGIDRVTDRTHARLSRLIDANLALYVSHLPLDAHRELGNAAGVADLIGLRQRDPFGSIGTETIGVRGEVKSTTMEELRDRLARNLDHVERDVRTLAFGPDRVRTVAIVTGSGTDWFDEAVEAGVDAFITGEGKAHLYHDAKESGVHVLLAGHYATETFGVRSLMALADQWGLETSFIDVPTDL